MARENDVNSSIAMLKGVTVLDLTNVLSGPLCTYQLSLLGARVIKIENPRGGDLARQLGASPELNKKNMGASFLAQNAGKESVCLNLKHPEGLALFKKLVVTADVVVENFRPGVIDRLGIGYEVLKELNPGIVLCSISGFGKTGPMSGNPAYDQIVQGLSGVMSVTGDQEQGSAPMRAGFPVCDSVGGLTAAFSIVAALFARQSSGIGRALDVSMLDSTLVTLGWVVSNFLSADVTPQAIGNENMTASPSGAFQAADGVINIAANKQEQFENLCDVIGCTELKTDQRFALREDRKLHRKTLNKLINQALSKNTAEHWELVLNEVGVPAGRVMTVPQILAHEQIKNRDIITSFDNDLFADRPLRVTGAGFMANNARPSANKPPPTLGQNTREVLSSLGVSEAELDQLHQASVINLGE